MWHTQTHQSCMSGSRLKKKFIIIDCVTCCPAKCMASKTLIFSCPLQVPQAHSFSWCFLCQCTKQCMMLKLRGCLTHLCSCVDCTQLIHSLRMMYLADGQHNCPLPPQKKFQLAHPWRLQPCENGHNHSHYFICIVFPRKLLHFWNTVPLIFQPWSAPFFCCDHCSHMCTQT